MTSKGKKSSKLQKKKYETPRITEEGGFERAVLQACNSDVASCQPTPPDFSGMPQNS